MQTSLRDIDWALLAIRIYTFLYNTFQVTTIQTIKSLKYLKHSFEQELYGFFEGSFLPVPVRYSYDDKPGASKPTFLYDRDSKTLLGQVNSNFHTLTFEEAKLYHGDICLYDLTSFFEETFYSVEERIPQIQIWLGTWCLENYVFLDMNKEFTLKVKTYMGEEHSFSIWNCEQDDWIRLIRPISLTRQEVITDQSAVTTTEVAEEQVEQPQGQAEQPEVQAEQPEVQAEQPEVQAEQSQA